jgi:membrane protein
MGTTRRMPPGGVPKMLASQAMLSMLQAVRRSLHTDGQESPAERSRLALSARAETPPATTASANSQRRTPEPGWWPMLRETGTQWSEHKASRLGAALAYYSIFSIGPLMVVAISIAGLVFGGDAVRGEVVGQLRGLLGENGAKAIEAMLAGANQKTEGVVATMIGLGTLLFAAIGVVVQLKDALNTVWEVKPSSASGIWSFVGSYVISLAAVVSVGFLLLTSLVLTAALAAVGKFIAPYLPEATLQIAGIAASFAMISLLFAMMFKWLPDAEVRWRDVWPGALLTAGLFEAGKFLIGLYIGKQGLESTYGAAASIVVVLIWVYYSAQIVLVGAEFTRAYAVRHGGIKEAGIKEKTT